MQGTYDTDHTCNVQTGEARMWTRFLLGPSTYMMESGNCEGPNFAVFSSHPATSHLLVYRTCSAPCSFLYSQRPSLTFRHPAHSSTDKIYRKYPRREDDKESINILQHWHMHVKFIYNRRYPTRSQLQQYSLLPWNELYNHRLQTHPIFKICGEWSAVE